MLTPSPLQQGDTVAILSPSGRVEERYVTEAAAVLQTWGFKAEVMPHATTHHGRFAAADEERLSDIAEAVARPDIRAILCSRGGYGAVRLLRDLEQLPLAANPKWLIGYSDITALHLLWNRHGVVSLHAPMARHLAENEGCDVSSQQLRALLQGEASRCTTVPHPLNRVGEVRAPLVGGNLSVLHALHGTPYQPNYAGKILFLEDIAEAPYHIERMFYTLYLSGALALLAGLVVGHFTRCPEDEGLGHTLYEMIAFLTASYNYPLFMGFPVGHEPHNMPLLVGAEALLCVTDEGGVLCQNDKI